MKIIACADRRSTWKRGSRKQIVFLLEFRSLILNYTKRKRTVKGTERTFCRVLEGSFGLGKLCLIAGNNWLRILIPVQ